MNIFVGCSSRDVGNTAYNRAADEIGSYIARKGHTLVFGGCKEGLMGRVYSKVYGHGKVICTQAKVYEEVERAKQSTEEEGKKSEVHISETINQRKDSFIQMSDVLVFLPGGIGTVDEFFASIESKRGGEHNNPMIIVNVDGYFDPMLAVLERTYSEGLASLETKKLYHIANSVEEAILALEVIEK